MSLWTALKSKLRRFVPAGRTYTDKKFGDLNKTLKEQQKLLDQQQKTMKKLLDQQQKTLEEQRKIFAQQQKLQKDQQTISKEQKKAHFDHNKAIESVKSYVDQEFSRRENWEKQKAEVQLQAKGRQIWVIKCPAPENPEVKRRWGDNAYALTLKRYLERKNIYVIIDNREDWNCEVGADVVLVLRGKFFYRPDRRNEKCVYIMWNISHPDLVTLEEYNLYDVVCVGSKCYAEQLREKLNVPVLPLLQCTDTELFYPAKEAPVTYDREYIFIGNSRGIARSCVMWAVDDQLPLRMWGGGWDKILADHQDLIEAPYIENSEIPELYRTSKVTLNDHWQDMLDKQFVNNRIFDALACGLPVISDACDELREIFPDAVLYYETKEEFEACIRKIETNYDAVKEKVDQQWELIQKEYSFERRVDTLVEIAEEYKRL